MTDIAGKKYVYIYNDEGSDPFFVSCLSQEFARELEDTGIGIRFIDAQKLKEDAFWQYDAAALVMPGGRDLPYANKLSGKGNDIIRQYVKMGGSYIGFCAGAYYACDKIEYDNGKIPPINEERELKFFEGKARGPVFGLDEVKAENFPASTAKIKTADGQTASFYYQEGPCLITDNKKGSEVLASYVMSDGTEKTAAVSCNIGKGKAVLCGFHPEVSGRSFAKGFKQYYQKEKLPLDFVKNLAKEEKNRKSFFKKIISASNIMQHQNVMIPLFLNKAKER